MQKTGTVLVIDDEDSIREVVSDALEIFSYTVLSATGGRQGVELFKQKRDEIDLIILDLSMPGMNGEETFTLLKAIDPDVKVLLSSGYSESDAISQFTAQGLAGFIQKPYKIETLLEIVNAHM